MGLIETLFDKRVMAMGPSRNDPTRVVGVFDQEFLAPLPALRSRELEKFAWLAGEWSYENLVPATRSSAAYTDVGTASFTSCENGRWICIVGRDGQSHRHITFDPFSRQWMYVLIEGSYGILRSPGWRGNQIVFTGLMNMLWHRM
ncbi:MAG: hypothetical protein C5B57_11200 [Blastocatellia bacterium]|nr:MAG: hypothetical protein C5B57_11200 [Blastocatellia bacterium]